MWQSPVLKALHVTSPQVGIPKRGNRPQTNPIQGDKGPSLPTSLEVEQEQVTATRIPREASWQSDRRRRFRFLDFMI